jgi:hypothetical protein
LGNQKVGKRERVERVRRVRRTEVRERENVSGV